MFMRSATPARESAFFAGPTRPIVQTSRLPTAQHKPLGVRLLAVVRFLACNPAPIHSRPNRGDAIPPKVVGWTAIAALPLFAAQPSPSCGFRQSLSRFHRRLACLKKRAHAGRSEKRDLRGPLRLPRIHRATAQRGRRPVAARSSQQTEATTPQPRSCHYPQRLLAMTARLYSSNSCPRNFPNPFAPCFPENLRWNLPLLRFLFSRQSGFPDSRSFFFSYIS